MSETESETAKAIARRMLESVEHDVLCSYQVGPSQALSSDQVEAARRQVLEAQRPIVEQLAELEALKPATRRILVVSDQLERLGATFQDFSEQLRRAVPIILSAYCPPGFAYLAAAAVVEELQKVERKRMLDAGVDDAEILRMRYRGLAPREPFLFVNHAAYGDDVPYRPKAATKRRTRWRRGECQWPRLPRKTKKAVHNYGRSLTGRRELARVRRYVGKQSAFWTRRRTCQTRPSQT